MQAAAPIVLFLLIMTVIYVATLSRWGFIERRASRNETRHHRILRDCARLSEARPRGEAPDATADCCTSITENIDLPAN